MLTTIVTWRDRQELFQAIPSLDELVMRVGGELIVVNFGGDSSLLVNQLGNRKNIRVLSVGHNEKWFNKSKAQNLGASVAKFDNLFFCDCDIILDVEETKELVEKVKNNPLTFGTIKGVRETIQNSRGAGFVTKFGYRLDIELANGNSLTIIDNEEDAKTGTRQAPGLLCVKKQDFRSVQGYNSQLLGWGWEDQDMISRLTLGLGLRRIKIGNALHISHTDEDRIRHYPPVESRWESRDRMFRQCLFNYDNGNFNGTFDMDILSENNLSER